MHEKGFSHYLRLTMYYIKKKQHAVYVFLFMSWRIKIATNSVNLWEKQHFLKLVQNLHIYTKLIKKLSKN